MQNAILLTRVKLTALLKQLDNNTIHRLEERGVERGSARQSSLQGRQRDIVSRISTGNCFKDNVGDNSERRGGAHNYGLSRAHGYHLERS